MKIRTTATLAALTTMIALPAAADAATLNTDRACYAPNQPIYVGGTGFPPGAPVVLSQDGRQQLVITTTPAGTFTAVGPATDIGSGERVTTFTAKDQATLTIGAAITTRLTALDVIGSLSGRPETPKRLRIRGFTTAKTLFAHIKKGRRVRTIRLGKVKKPCGTLRVRKRFFPRNNVANGLYTIQIDGKRRYSNRTRPALIKAVNIFTRIVRRSSPLEGPWTARY